MKRSTKIWIITATLLIIAGSAVFCGIMSRNNWDFSVLSNENYDTRTIYIEEDFQNISVACDAEDVSLLHSDDGKCSVIFYEDEKQKHAADVADGTLSINTTDTRKWYEHIAVFSFDTPKITIYLPKTEYASLVVRTLTGDISLPKNFKFENIEASTETGDIRCENIKAGEISFLVSTGRIDLNSVVCEGAVEVNETTGKLSMKDVSCKKLNTNGDTGDVTLENVIATEILNIKRSTGDVIFKACDAKGLVILTNTGDITGSLISDKTFIAKTDTGHVNVPQMTGEGKCIVTTSTGDIFISITE